MLKKGTVHELHSRIGDLVSFLVCLKVPAFKHPSTLLHARQINSGVPDPSQIGKIFTIYSAKGTGLEHIIDRLRSWLGGGSGPKLVSDLWAEPGGRLGLRFGSFDHQIYLDEVGRVRPGLKLSNGETIEDYRSTDGAQSPIAPKRLTFRVYNRPTAPLSSPMMIGRMQFFPLALIASSPKGKIFLALQGIHPYRQVIIKTALRGVACSDNGLDAQDLLEREIAVGERLGAEGLSLFNLVSFEKGTEESRLAMEDMGGASISYFPTEIQRPLLHQILDEVGKLHHIGIIHRDIKPENILVVGNTVRLIDFEIASEIMDLNPPGAYTPGFCIPQDAYKTSPGRDYFALAMTLIQLVLGLPAVSAPLSHRKCVNLLRILGEHEIAQVVNKLFQAHLLGCTIDLSALAMKIRKLNPTRKKKTKARLLSKGRKRPVNCGQKWRRKVVTDAILLLMKEKRQNSLGLYWENPKTDEDLLSASLATGVAGIIISLLTFSRYHDTSRILDNNATHRAAQWLAAQPSTSRSGGLFTGHAGVALVLAVAGKRFNDRNLLLQSQRFFKCSRQGAFLDSDFYFGGSGIVYAGVCIAGVLSDESVLAHVVPAVTFLKQTALNKSGLCYWESSEVLGPPRSPNLSLAHGAAGAALALGMYGRLTGDCEAQQICAAALYGVVDKGKDLFDSQIRTATDDDRQSGPAHFWCRGLGGVLWAYLQYFDSRILRSSSRVKWMADRLLQTPAAGNVSLCHGLGGRIELLRMLSCIDTYQHQCRTSLRTCQRVLENCSVRTKGLMTWPTEEAHIFSNELWLGGLSAATSIALLDSEHFSPLISTSNLRALSEPKGKAYDAA